MGWQKYTTNADDGAFRFYNEALDLLVECGITGAIFKVSKPVAATTLFEVDAAGNVSAGGTISGGGAGANIVKLDELDQFGGLTLKAVPDGADLILIESAADGGAKRKVRWSDLPSGGGGGVSSFTDLDDVDNDYAGDGLKFVRVKATEDGLEYADVPDEITDSLSAISGHPDQADFLPIWEDGVGLKKISYWDVETQQVHFYVKNGSGSPISKGVAVSVAADDTGIPVVVPADPSSRGKMAIGVTEASIPSGSFGWVVNRGRLESFDTSSWVAGDLLYVGLGGALTITPPDDNIQCVGVVTVSSPFAGRAEITCNGVHRADFIKTLYENNDDTNAFTDAEKSKLGGIEAGATGDQTGAEIKALYEGEADTNAFTDAEKSKLAGIEAGADVTDAANVAAAGAHMAGGTDVPVTDGGTGASDATTARANLGAAYEDLTMVDVTGTSAEWEAGTGLYHRCDNASTITITLGTSIGAEIGNYAYFEQVGAGAVSFGASGTTIRSKSSSTRTNGTRAVVLAVVTAENEITLFGDLLQKLDINDLTTATVVTEGEGIAANDNDTTLPTSAAVKDFGDTKGRWEMVVAVSDETTDLTTGTAKVTFRMPRAVTLTAVRASVNTAPVGSTIIVDINESGSTILSTKLSIDASEKTSTTAATPAVISDTALADDAEITIDIDQVGSSTAGKGLKVALIGRIA